jgi:cytoskeleton-associated protein 5
MPPTPFELTRPPHASNTSRETLAADWANAVATLVSSDEQTAVAAMKTICLCLKNLAAGEYGEDASALFAADADKLVDLLSTQVSRTFEAAASAAVQPAPSRGCKYVLNALMQTFSVVRMARAVAEPTVRAVIGELLLRLLDDRVARIEEGGQLVRALNLLMLKILENANRTSTFVALLLMLRKAPASLVASDAERRVRFSDLVVKCLIKLTRTLGGSLAGLDVSEVLLTIHSFFMVLGVDEIRRRGADDDRPLRMVKTVLYELTKVLGPGINAHLTKVPPPTFEPTPLIYAYIQLNLQSLAASGVIAPGADTTVVDGLQSLDASEAGEFGTATLGSGSLNTTMPPPPATPTHDLKAQLAAIFRKIGDKTTTAEGIEELFAFKQEQPGIDITPHLAKTSEAFQLYIQRGLAKVEASRSTGDLAAMARGPSPGAAEPSAPQSAAEAYQERLQRVKAAQAAGLSSSASFPSGAMQQSVAGGEPVAVAAAAPGSRQNLDALRERMRSIAAKASTELPAARPTTAPVSAAAVLAPPSVAAATAAVEPPSAAPAPARAGGVSLSLSELQARMARIRELSQGNAS